MSIIDIVILTILVIALFRGIRKGFAKQISSLIGLILGVLLACSFSASIGRWLTTLVDINLQASIIISFIIIIFGVVISLNLIAKIIIKFLKSISLEWLDELLGAIFSILLSILVLGLIISFINYSNENWLVIIPQHQIENSILYNFLVKLTNLTLPYLKEFFSNIKYQHIDQLSFIYFIKKINFIFIKISIHYFFQFLYFFVKKTILLKKISSILYLKSKNKKKW